MNPSNLTGLAELFPADRFRTDPAAQAAFESDGLLAYTARPRGVVFPETADEVVAAVRWCYEHHVPVVARGSGTGLSGGAMPHRDGIVISLNRLNRILHVDPVERTATVQCGVVNLAVSQAARPHGLYFAPDPSSQSVCTIGGNIAFNSGGAHCLKYGMTAGHTLAMDVVLGDGTVTSIGGSSLEHAGPDSTGFICGNEGMLGIALQATLRLLPLPEVFHTVLVGYNDIRAAGNAVGAIIAANLLPGAMEIMDAMSIRAAEAAVACGYPKNANSVLIVELEGSAERVAMEKKILAEVIASTQPSAVEIAANDAERLAIWKGRKSVFSAAGRLSPDFIVQDGVVPRRCLGEALERIEAMSQECGVPVANVFHAGDGNLHPLIMYDGKIPDAFDKANEFAHSILRLCIEMGGSITGEHGVGIEKRGVFAEMFDEPTIDLMHRVRAEMDPHEICNRGKMFPDAESPALSTSGLHPLEKAGVIFRE